MTDLTKSVEKFCTDPDFLTPFVSPGDVQSADKLRNYICDTTNMNVTVLLHELSQMNGFPQLMEALQVRTATCLQKQYCYYHLVLNVGDTYKSCFNFF